MRQESLLCQLKRRFAPTTDSAHSFRRYPNLIEDIELQEPDECWVADITYVRLPSTFCYLAAILKGHPPYALGTSDGALFSPGCCGALIHHSDQGVQYASSEYVIRLEEAGARISMASVGNPYESAKAESFFRTLKREEVYLKAYKDFEEAYQNIAQFIEEVYNQKRLHSSLGYLPPVEFEA